MTRYGLGYGADRLPFKTSENLTHYTDRPTHHLHPDFLWLFSLDLLLLLRESADYEQAHCTTKY